MTTERTEKTGQQASLSLSHAQRAIWLDARLVGDPTAYQIGTISSFAAPIDPDLARQAVRLMMGRHESLRMRVDAVEPRQWVETAGKVPFRLTDVSSAADPERAADERLAAIQAEGFALGDESLFKVDLIKLAPSRWRMQLICHHLVADGISLALAQREWLLAYRTLSGEAGDDGDEAEPLPPRSTYAPLIDADAVYRESPRYDEDLAYWLDRLSSPPEPLLAGVLPPAAHVEESSSDLPAVTLGKAALDRLDQACRRIGTTLHRALTALFAVALGRRYDRNDLTIGMAIHRRDAATRHVIGAIAGMIPVRCRIPQAGSLDRTIEAIAVALGADIEHQRTPVDAIGRSLLKAHPEADHLRKGLFEAAVTIMGANPLGQATLGGAPVGSAPLRIDERTPIALYVNELAGKAGLMLELRWNRAILPSAEAVRLLSVLVGVIEAFSAAAETRLSDINGLATGERKSIRNWSHGRLMLPPEGTLPDIFEDMARRQPEALAAIADEGNLTYADLDRAADRVAARLRSEGVQPGASVGVAMRRSLASIAAILGILKAEAVYLPLDPDYPAERLAGMIADAEAGHAIATPDTAEILPASIAQILFDGDFPLSGPNADPTPRVQLTPDSRAYVIFTSGSTGRPKGVAMSHAALANLAAARLDHDPIGPGDRILAAISIGFDVSLGQLLTPLLTGSTIVVAGDIRGISGDAFWDFMTRHGVTHVNSVPSFFASVLDSAPATISLRRLMLGGEPLSGALATRLQRRLGVPVVNMYGPTEACIDASSYTAPSAGIEDAGVLPIGRPLPNYALHILDRTLRPAPIGVEGELCIGGPGLAEGYVGLPELTAERFVETRAFGRLYRTGDRVAWREDGEIAFLGRTDAQVKIRGFRVELGEIESVIAAQPGVGQVVVIARPDARGETRLLAFVTPDAGAAMPDCDVIRHALRARLPGHMVPAAIVSMAMLPLTINGKLDERALVVPEETFSGVLTPPRTQVERQLVDAFRKIFPADQIGVESDFFALGGHSLLATQLATALRGSLGVEVPLRLIFEAPMIADLAPRIEALPSGAAGLTNGFQLLPRPPLLPLSSAQARLWFLAQMDPRSPAYNIPVSLRLKGRLDPTLLEQALDALALRHESLRTRFLVADGEPRQAILADRKPAFVHVSLPELRDDELRTRATAEALRPFDLTHDPLLRVTLLDSPNDSQALLLTIHHIIADGASMPILFRDLAALYESARAGKPDGLPALSCQFADVALWESSPDHAAEAEQDLAYWRQVFADAPEALSIGSDFPRPAKPTGQGASIGLDLGPELTMRVESFARSHRTTPFAVLLAAWAGLLGRWSRQDEVVIGAPLANREGDETAGMIGFLVNTVALRANLAEAPSFQALVSQLTQRFIAAHAHRRVAFDRLIEAVAPRRELGRNPIFQAMFAYQPALPASLDFAGVAAEPLPLLEQVAKFDLTLNLGETEEGIRGALTYATDLFASETMERMARQFRRVLDAALSAPAAPLQDIPLLEDAERKEWLARSAGLARPVPAATVPTLFAQQAKAHGQHPAAIFGSASLSYAELDERTNRLAHALIRAGVAPEMRVAVMLRRSEALVVAALGVMKAGGAYLPIEPAYPDARIGAILDDAAPAVLIADGSTIGRAPTGLQVIDLDTIDLSGQPAHAPTDADRHAPLAPKSAAYLIYTSGSTGQPKGVVMSHAGLLNLATARLDHDPIGRGDRILATMSVGFDVSVGQLVTPLLTGATIVVAGDLGTMSGVEFWRMVAGQGITHVNSGPAFFDAALETPPPELPLRRIMLGGEPFLASLAHKIHKAIPNAEIFNMYGPTEACIDATCHRFRGDEEGAVLPIGKPLPNYRILILDERLAPVPDGIPGEIFIGGASLARGYLNRPEENERRFVADPFGAPGERLYCTGDLARRNRLGEIEFLGRIDSQVKLRGFRIELDEIAAVLRSLPGVATTAVIARERGPAKMLVAYVVPADRSSPIDPEALCIALAARLPAYMVPSAIIPMDALPMTPNGKIDTRALPAPEEGGPEEAAAPPRDALDARMLEAWRKLLGDAVTGIDTNFFAAGGHSLLAMRLVVALRDVLGLALPVTALFRFQTIRALADAHRSGALAEDAGPAVDFGGEGAPTFCIHPVGGSAMVYRGLAQSLAGKARLVGLQAADGEGAQSVPTSLEDMAAGYIAAIRKLQPNGPYRLLGHSFGGMVAFEMTRQLEAAGEAVERLAMLDTSIPTGRNVESGDVAAILASLSSGLSADEARRLAAVVGNNIRIGELYRASPIQTPVLYVEAARHEEDERAAHWLALSGGGSSSRIGAGHYDMLEPPHLAELIQALGL